MTSVLIATNEPVLARGFEAIITKGGLEVVDICRDVVHLFDCFRRSKPDVAILDMAVPELTGVLVELRKLAPRCQLLIWPRQILQPEADELVRLGARGVLPSDISPEVLVATLEMVGAFPASEVTPGALVKQVCSSEELRIISLVGCGMRNEEIAVMVQSDIRTVDQQVKTLSRRLGAQDRYELALYGLSMSGEGFESRG